MTTDYDRWLIGHRSWPATVECDDCGHSFDGTMTEEYGAAVLEPEECPACGSADHLNVFPMDEQDIQERKAEARGEDF
jgi:Zn ribbon nucleic-acid-binding protein